MKPSQSVLFLSNKINPCTCYFTFIRKNSVCVCVQCHTMTAWMFQRERERETEGSQWRERQKVWVADKEKRRECFVCFVQMEEKVEEIEQFVLRTTCLIFTCGAVWMNPPGFKIWDFCVFKCRGQMKKVWCEYVCFCTLWGPSWGDILLSEDIVPSEDFPL